MDQGGSSRQSIWNPSTMHRALLTLPLLFALFSSAYCDWKLVCSDDFNGSQLRDSEWNYDLGCDGWGNNELQCYTANRSKNVRVEKGHLVIDVQVENYQGHHFTSGRIKSKK